MAAPATHMGDSGGVLGSCFWPGSVLAFGKISLCLSLFLSLLDTTFLGATPRTCALGL